MAAEGILVKFFLSSSRTANIRPTEDQGAMLPLAVFYLAAVICSARWTRALPLYPDGNMETDTDLIQKFVSEVEDGPEAGEGEQSQANNLYPLLTQHNRGRDSWNKGSKDSAQQDKFGILMKDLREAVAKLEAADKLRSQGFVRSEQNLPKTNKRACFWKYCVTN